MAIIENCISPDVSLLPRFFYLAKLELGYMSFSIMVSPGMNLEPIIQNEVSLKRKINTVF